MIADSSNIRTPRKLSPAHITTDLNIYGVPVHRSIIPLSIRAMAWDRPLEKVGNISGHFHWKNPKQ